ncbi:Bifunctional phosphatase IMPL2 [Citrus sinensis]|nr:Bifunctional phosphatase IMPL2 [Citrus sinensis]
MKHGIESEMGALTFELEFDKPKPDPIAILTSGQPNKVQQWHRATVAPSRWMQLDVSESHQSNCIQRLGPVTIADRTAEEAMVLIIQENLPSHAIFGEENGWRCKEKFADYVWVLDPIDGTKSFITGKPLFGTLIALLHKGKPILGIIDQPVLRERWIGISGKCTTLNGEEVSTRTCAKLSQAYLYTTSPHLFKGDAEEAFARVRNKVKVPLYGCDCYAYALLASGYVDLVIESGLQPYDVLALIPVIEGAGGVITDWRGDQLYWEASSDARATSFNVIAAGDKQIHQQALDVLQWQ